MVEQNLQALPSQMAYSFLSYCISYAMCAPE